MFARLALNVTATMMPLYLVTVTEFGTLDGSGGIPPQIAVVPLCSYVCSLIFSVKFQAPMTQYLRNRLLPMIISLVVTTVGSLPYAFLDSNTSTNWLVYPCAAIQGVGIAMMLNTGTSLISDVIGKDSQSAAFVYGIYSFLDKFANGILLYFLVALYSDNAEALKFIIATVPIIAAVGTVFFTWLGMKLYPDKLAKISEGSRLRKKEPVAPMSRKGSVAQMDAP